MVADPRGGLPRSRVTKDDQIRALHDKLGPTPHAYQLAERQVADALGRQPEDLKGWETGEVAVIEDESDAAVERLRDLFRTHPTSEVADVSVALLAGSYDRGLPHEFVRQLVEHFYDIWKAGEHGLEVRGQLRDLAEPFSHAVRADEYDLVMQLCSDESLAVDEDGERDIEDLRNYWFASLANLDDARVRPFCRALLEADRDRWEDYRAVDALEILARYPDAVDREVVAAYAESDPDSEVRRDARRLLKKFQ